MWVQSVVTFTTKSLAGDCSWWSLRSREFQGVQQNWMFRFAVHKCPKLRIIFEVSLGYANKVCSDPTNVKNLSFCGSFHQMAASLFHVFIISLFSCWIFGSIMTSLSCCDRSKLMLFENPIDWLDLISSSPHPAREKFILLATMRFSKYNPTARMAIPALLSPTIDTTFGCLLLSDDNSGSLGQEIWLVCTEKWRSVKWAADVDGAKKAFIQPSNHTPVSVPQGDGEPVTRLSWKEVFMVLRNTKITAKVGRDSLSSSSLGYGT